MLVIGYGNDLRNDDGAGRRVADEIEQMALPGVTVRSVPQLTPELALDVAASARVVFVDASVDALHVTATPVVAGAGSGIMSHHGDPAGLLRLTETVGPVPASALVVSIPAVDLGLGSRLSPATEAGVTAAVELVVRLAADPDHHSSGPE